MLPAKKKTVVAIACAVGLAAGILTYLASQSTAQAVLTAGAAIGSSSELLHRLLTQQQQPHRGDDSALSPPHSQPHPSDSDPNVEASEPSVQQHLRSAPGRAGTTTP